MPSSDTNYKVIEINIMSLWHRDRQIENENIVPGYQSFHLWNLYGREVALQFCRERRPGQLAFIWKKLNSNFTPYTKPILTG